jgi:uncharacterized membrane protein
VVVVFLDIVVYKNWFIVGSLILILLAVAPTLTLLVPLPNNSEAFSELWLLGPKHRAEGYPFNVTRLSSYDVFLGIGNHLGHAAYYLVEVKFRNQTQSAPNSFNHTASSLSSLFNITAFVADQGTWELPLSFSFNYKYNVTLSQVKLYSMTLNDISLDIGNCIVTWDSNGKGFFGYLFFELWIYTGTTDQFQYHERFLSLRLNMTY